MSEVGAPLPPLHARHVRSLTRLLTAREDALVLCIAPEGVVRPRIEAALRDALGTGFEVRSLDLPRESESAWTSMTAQAAEVRASGRRPVLSVSLRLGDVDEMARLNLGRESRQREGLLVLLWLPGVEAYEEFRVRSPDVWSHRTELRFFLTRDDLAAVAEREGLPLVTLSNTDLAERADRADFPGELMRLHRQQGAPSDDESLLRRAEAQLDELQHLPVHMRDVARSEVERQRIVRTLRTQGSLAAIAEAQALQRELPREIWPNTTNMIATALNEALVVQGRYAEGTEALHQSAIDASTAHADFRNPLNVLFDSADVALNHLSTGHLVEVMKVVDHLQSQVPPLRSQQSTGDVRDVQKAEIQANINWLLGRKEWLSGKGETAFLHIQRALRAHVDLRNGYWIGTIRAFRAELSIELGVMSGSDFKDRFGQIRELRSAFTSPPWRLEQWPQDVLLLRAVDRQSLAKTRTALRHLEQAGLSDPRAVVRDDLCHLCLAQGRLDEARRLARAQVQDARSAQSPLRAARALVLLGRVEAARALHHDALVCYRDATAALNREPPQYRSLFAMRDIAIWRARSEHALGRSADARVTLNTILAELNAQQLRLVTLDVLHDLSVITPPDDPEAERIAEEALSIAQDASALWFEARAMLDLAFVRQSRGSPTQTLVTEAEAILTSYGDPITLQQFRDRVPAT